MGHNGGRKALDVQARHLVQSQQIVAAHAQGPCQPDQHFDGGLNILVLPVGDRLLGDIEPPGQLHLVLPKCTPQLPQPLTKHGNPSEVKFHNTIINQNLTFIKYYGIVIFDYRQDPLHLEGQFPRNGRSCR